MAHIEFPQNNFGTNLSKSNFMIMYKLINCIVCVFFICFFIVNKTGKEYGLRRFKKLKLVFKIFLINKNRKDFIFPLFQHVFLIHEILMQPKSLKGDVVECGCGNGISTISLSLACALTNRRLIVCDSFEGLPEPKKDEKYVFFRHINKYSLWQKGQYASAGGLEGVKERIEKCGNIEACDFIKGYFKDILKDSNIDSIILIFVDADLVSSVKDCLRYLWPKLQEGCKFYSHEPWSMDVVSLFFNKDWWEKELKTDPPGFYFSGGIIGGLGYAIKSDTSKIKYSCEEMVDFDTKDAKIEDKY